MDGDFGMHLCNLNLAWQRALLKIVQFHNSECKAECL